MPVLLVAVAAHQLYAANFSTLSPWKGGGFGMFASIDRINCRTVRAYLLTQGGETPIDLSLVPRLRRPMRWATTYPTDGQLSGIARELAGLRRTVGQPPATGAGSTTSTGCGRTITRQSSGVARAVPIGPSATPGSAAAEDVRGIRVEVWRIKFDAGTERLSSAMLNQITEVRS